MGCKSGSQQTAAAGCCRRFWLAYMWRFMYIETCCFWCVCIMVGSREIEFVNVVDSCCSGKNSKFRNDCPKARAGSRFIVVQFVVLLQRYLRRRLIAQLLNTDLWVSGESSSTGGPLNRPPLAMGVWPVQKTHT